MGRKRTRIREYLHLSIACIIFLSIAGCGILNEKNIKMKAQEEGQATRETREHLIKAQKLFEQGDYEGSLKENQKVLSLNQNVPPGDEALFHTGLIYVHYDYPKRDYQKSLDNFKRLAKVFPKSPFAGQARIWIRILQENERLNGEIERLNKTIKKSKQVDIELEEKKKELSK